MDQLILQLGDRPGRMAELVRSHGDTLTVGRNFANDAVISDPYVDPEQITFFRTAEGWSVRLLQETNPATLNGKLIDKGGVRVDSGDRITIGRTQLHIYSSDHVVEPTHKTLLSFWFRHGQSHLVFALLMLAFACAVTVFEQYQLLSTEIKWKEMLSVSLWLAVVIFFWASAWALAGRLLRQQPNFTAQLGFTALVSGVLSILSPLDSYAGYAVNSELLGELMLWLIWLTSLAALLRANLSFATNLKHPATIGFVAASAILLTTYAMLELRKQEFSSEPEYPAILKPPFAYLSGSRSTEAYRDAFDGKFELVDTQAREE